MSHRAPPPTDEPFMDKLVRKCTNEPFVPLGTAATCFFLYQGLRAFHKGQKTRAQSLMRGRVFAQAVTVIAMAGYAFMGMKPHDRPANVEEIVEKNNAETAAREARLEAGRQAKLAREAAAAAAAAAAAEEKKA